MGVDGADKGFDGGKFHLSGGSCQSRGLGADDLRGKPTEIGSPSVLIGKGSKCDDLFPGCDFHAEAETEDELLQKAAAHAASVHNITELTDEFVAQVKSCIRDA